MTQWSDVGETLEVSPVCQLGVVRLVLVMIGTLEDLLEKFLSLVENIGLKDVVQRVVVIVCAVCKASSLSLLGDQDVFSGIFTSLMVVVCVTTPGVVRVCSGNFDKLYL